MRLQCVVPTSEKFTVQLTVLSALRAHCFIHVDNGVGQFKPMSQVEGNTFHPILFGYFIAD